MHKIRAGPKGTAKDDGKAKVRNGFHAGWYFGVCMCMLRTLYFQHPPHVRTRARAPQPVMQVMPLGAADDLAAPHVGDESDDEEGKPAAYGEMSIQHPLPACMHRVRPNQGGGTLTRNSQMSKQSPIQASPLASTTPPPPALRP